MEWKLVKRKLADLVANEKNPRKMSKSSAADLKRSIEEFGYCQPIVANWDNTIIGGHQRVKILEKLGYEEVDVYLPSDPLSEEEVNKLGIRLNKNQGNFDYDLLANFWDPDELIDLGFSAEELHLESLSGTGGSSESEAPKKVTMTITFKNEDHLQEAENLISTIVDEYEGATYKVKVK